MLFYILFLILIPIILSYIILKFIYRKIFKSQKKVSKILVFLGSVGLIVFYYTPYSYYLEPSFWQFSKMCELSELPDSEEKYNKILSYFDKKLGDTDDFSHIKQYSNRIALSILIYHNEYYNGQSIASFADHLKIDNMAISPSKEKYKLDFNTIKSIRLEPEWDTNRITFYGNEGNMQITWDFKNTVACGNLDLYKKTGSMFRY